MTILVLLIIAVLVIIQVINFIDYRVENDGQEIVTDLLSALIFIKETIENNKI